MKQSTNKKIAKLTRQAMAFLLALVLMTSAFVPGLTARATEDPTKSIVVTEDETPTLESLEPLKDYETAVALLADLDTIAQALPEDAAEEDVKAVYDAVVAAQVDAEALTDGVALTEDQKAEVAEKAAAILTYLTEERGYTPTEPEEQNDELVCPGDDCTIEGCANHQKAAEDASFLLDGVAFMQPQNVAQSKSTYVVNQQYLALEKPVFWDVAEYTGENKSGYSGYDGNPSTRVESITFADKPITWQDSDKTSGFRNGSGQTATKVHEYYGYPNGIMAANQKVISKDLVIKPAKGYYVTKVVVACTCSVEYYGIPLNCPYNCGTWNAGGAFDEDYTLDDDEGSLTVSIPSEYFGHTSYAQHPYDDAMFILVVVEPLPSPLYVEYNCGDISGDIFKDADAWIKMDSSDKYNFGVDENGIRYNGTNTAYTQFEHKYAGNLTGDAAAEATKAWKHSANFISDTAHAAAAQQGMRFVGWQVEYFGDCTLSDEPDGKGNLYTYTFEKSYGNSANIQPGDPVELLTHVKLTALWETIPDNEKFTSLQLDKVVEGSGANPDQKFIFTVSAVKDNRPVSFTVPDGVAYADNTATITLSANDNPVTITKIPLGATVTIQETAAEGYTTTATLDGNPAAMENGAISYTAGSIGKKYAVEFKNTKELEYGNVLVRKTVDSNFAEDTNQKFEFTATLSGATFPDSLPSDITRVDETTATFSLKHNATVMFTDLPAGSTLTIKETEDPNYETDNDKGTGLEAVVSVTANQTVEVNYKNTRKNGSVKVTKTVIDSVGFDPNAEFTFYAVLKKDNEEIAFPEAVTTDGDVAFLDERMKAEFQLKKDEKVIFNNLPVGTVVNVVETPNNSYSTDYKVNGDDKSTPEVRVEADKEGVIAYTNTLKVTTLLIKKTVSGNMGDRNKKFSFTVTMADAESEGKSIGFSVPEGVTYNAEEKNAAFSLGHDGEVRLSGIPVGAFVTVTETPDGYTASARLNDELIKLQSNNTTAKFQIVDEDEDILIFNNDLTSTIETGISLDSIPYIVILVGVAAVVGFLFLRKRRIED